MVMNGVLAKLPKALSFVSISTLGMSLFFLRLHLLIYGRYGGYGSTEWDFGVRNLLFSSPSPSVPVKTWIRLRGGETRAAIELD